MTGELVGRFAVVTGAGTGIGRGLAREAARRGATVLVVDVYDPGETVALVEKDGGRAVGAVCDITDAAALEALAAEHGDVDLVCANVGTGMAGTILTLTASDFRRILEVNVVGTAATVQAFLPGLLAARAAGRPASILITGSEHSLGVPPYVTPMSAYTTSKHALLGLAGCMRRDLASDGIAVTILCPSYVRTERLQARADESAAIAEVVHRYAQEVDEVARLGFDGLAAGALVVPTNPVSTEFVTELHTSIIDAMPPTGDVSSAASHD
jgi:NAD(P)-dependent dehydrogenase (short-subunit alcohol dehydrogenase family)